MTEEEIILWARLKDRQVGGCKFRRQHSVGRYVLDFYCPARKLAIELDGGQHAESDAMEYDVARTEYLHERGIQIVRFWNNEVREQLEGVLEKIGRILEGKETTPRP